MSKKIILAIWFLSPYFISIPAVSSTKIGAKIHVALFEQTGNGTEDSKSNTAIAQQKVDLFFFYSERKTMILIQFDFLQAPFMQAFDDAWAQYSFQKELALKAGIDMALSSSYGYFTEFYRPVIIDEVRGLPKIELSGGISSIEYALQFWEDEAPDQTTEDKDSGILTNFAIEAKYKVRNMETGLIYRVDKGWEDENTNTREQDKTGYQLYGKYVLKAQKLSLWAEYSQKYITSDQVGNTSLILGVNYFKISPFKFGASMQNLSSLANKNDDTSEVESGSVTQLIADYIFNKNLTYFAQLLMYGEKSVGNAEAYNLLGVGIRARF